MFSFYRPLCCLLLFGVLTTVVRAANEVGIKVIEVRQRLGGNRDLSSDWKEWALYE